MHSSSDLSSAEKMAITCQTAGDCTSDCTLSAVTVYPSSSSTKKEARMAYGQNASQMCAHTSCSGTIDCTSISTSFARPAASSASSCTSAWWNATILVSCESSALRLASSSARRSRPCAPEYRMSRYPVGVTSTSLRMIFTAADESASGSPRASESSTSRYQE